MLNRTRAGYRLYAVAIQILLATVTYAQSCPQVFGSGSGNSRDSSHKFFSPEEAAHSLIYFGATNRDSSRAMADAVRRKSTDKVWDYLRVGEQTIAAQVAAGNGASADQHNVEYMLHPKSQSSAELATFWGHEYNRGSAIDVPSSLRGDGVTDRKTLLDSLNANSDFLLVEYSGDTFRPDEVYGKNTVYMHASDRPSKLDFSRIKLLSEKLLATLPLGRGALSGETRLVIASAKATNGEHIVMLVDLDKSRSARRLVAELHTITNNPAAHRDLLAKRFKALGNSGRVYVYGDDLPSDVTEIAHDLGLEVVRRSITTEKDFTVTDRQLSQLRARPLERGSTAVFNGLPNTAAELDVMGFPSASLNGWREFDKQASHVLSKTFRPAERSRLEFLKEVSGGNSDVLLIIAHSDGASIYLGGEKITLTDLKSLPNSRTDQRPRVAVLVSCFAGRLSDGRQRLFRRQVQSLGEIFVNKGFFDEVIAPEGEITGTESIPLLETAIDRLTAGLAGSINGMLRIARNLLRSDRGRS